MNDSVDLSLLRAPVATGGAIDGLAGRSGSWQLGAGRALSLQARQAGVLSIAHGRVWVTLDHPERNSTQRAGDHFLSRGESLCLLPGESLVMESLGIGHEPSACFRWEPARARHGEAASSAGWRAMTALLGRTVSRLATAFAIGFVAARARCTSAERSFSARTCGH